MSDTLCRDTHARDLDRFLRAECGLTLAQWSERFGMRASTPYASEDGREASMQAKERSIVRYSMRRTA